MVTETVEKDIDVTLMSRPVWQVGNHVSAGGASRCRTSSFGMNGKDAPLTRLRKSTTCPSPTSTPPWPTIMTTKKKLIDTSRKRKRL